MFTVVLFLLVCCPVRPNLTRPPPTPPAPPRPTPPIHYPMHTLPWRHTEEELVSIFFNIIMSRPEVMVTQGRRGSQREREREAQRQTDRQTDRAFRTASHLPTLSNSLVQQRKTNLKSAGNRPFRFQAAKIWNSLPTNVRISPSLSSFKKNLKHIFLKKASLLGCKTPFSAQFDY